MIPEQQDMEIESDDKTSIQVPTNTYEQSTPYNYDDPPSPDQPAFKSACVEPPSSLSVFSPNAPQVETVVPEIELVSYDMAFANVKRTLLFSEGGNMDTTTDSPVTRSAARAKRIIIPESVPLSDSDEDVRMILRHIRLVAYGASQSPAAFAKMSADVIVPFSAPVSVGSQVEQSHIPSSSTVMPRFGGRFQLNTKANRTTAATAFTPSINYEDMPALVSSSSDDGDM
jgi:hypothetical protein